MARLYIPPLTPLIEAITIPVEGELPQVTLRKVIEERVERFSNRNLLEAVFDICFSPSQSRVNIQKVHLKLWLETRTGESLHIHYCKNKSRYVMSLAGHIGMSCLDSQLDENKQWVEAFLLLVRGVGK